MKTTITHIKQLKNQCKTKRHGVLCDVTGRYRSIADRYGTLREHYGALTEPLLKISILPITN